MFLVNQLSKMLDMSQILKAFVARYHKFSLTKSIEETAVGSVLRIIA